MGKLTAMKIAVSACAGDPDLEGGRALCHICSQRHFREDSGVSGTRVPLVPHLASGPNTYPARVKARPVQKTGVSVRDREATPKPGSSTTSGYITKRQKDHGYLR